MPNRCSTFQWQWKNHSLTIATETFGHGSPLLMLPAFSTVSTRDELRSLAQQLASRFRITLLDWPGFGDSDRPNLHYHPQFYRQFLQDFVTDRYSEPVAIIAAGHSTGYALTLSDYCSKLALIAPTWIGPLAAMGVPPAIRETVRGLIHSPVLGQALYSLNTQPQFLKHMYQRHVVVDESKLTPDYLAERHAVTQKPGARFAPAAFVTGGLDLCHERTEFLSLVKNFHAPIMVIVAEQSPPTSKAEMEAIASLPHVTNISHPGSLGMAEEFGPELGRIIQSFFCALR